MLKNSVADRNKDIDMNKQSICEKNNFGSRLEKRLVVGENGGSEVPSKLLQSS